MPRILFSFWLIIVAIGSSMAQDTIVLNGQPNWKTALDIGDQSLFYEEYSDKPLTFEEVVKQPFGPFEKQFRHLKHSTRPHIIQWYKFIVSNTSATDTVDLRLTLAPHYFTRLYANDGHLIARAGVYETDVDDVSLYDLPVNVPPYTTRTFWARTDDRKDQFVSPNIKLKTPFINTYDNLKSVNSNRYLFMLLAALSGCLFFICLYALYQYYLYRDSAFKWYITYTIASFFISLYWIDIRMQEHLFPALFRDIIFSTFVFLVPVLYSFFIGRMLQFSVHFKKGWPIVKALVIVAIVQATIQFLEVRFGWFIFNPDWYGIFTSVIPVVLLNSVLLVLTAKSKDPVKWFLFGGLVSMLFFWCLGLVGIFARIPYPNYELFVIVVFQPAFMLFGITVEAICFSFALSYRSKLVLVEKNDLQKNYNLQLEAALQERTTELETQNKLIETQKIKQIETAFEHKIAETEMTALRAQMNPHFIFNCLNSIKLYTLENDGQTASEYLTMFSQLIRLVLENSHSEKVSLLKELETLRLYIELEAMRFKHKVQYEINVQLDIDQHYTEIPPLLLQPYVENAIWHGLMHKKEGGNLRIDVSQPSEHLLHIEISDDGVGRALAAAYKSKSATRQKSFGLQMTSERIHIINQLYQMETDVTITDLKDGNNRATGTRVTIQIPI